MAIKKLNLTSLRAYTQAEFEFKVGMNLLVGINGVGKTTVLDALRICLSIILPNITASKSRKDSFAISDIKIGSNTLQVSCDFEFKNSAFNLLIQKQRESNIVNNPGNPREQVTATPDKELITPSLTEATKLPNQPIGVFFSTKRSLISEKAPTKSSAVGGQSAAFADALSDSREFNLNIFAQWFKVQQELGKENRAALKNLEVLKTAVSQFLPQFSNLDITEEDDKTFFTIEKAGTTLSIEQLSDGERGVLALVLDIARRLSQANPGSENPLRDGTGTILIDELDLHLHPKWQRSIVENLTRVFPSCQFIVTTHSPQIIGEVKPDFITVIDNGTHRPASSYGVDSSRVLDEILDTPPRNKDVDALLNQLYKSIDEEKLDAAKEQIAQLILVLGPP
ncbi:MAG: AAA family ATPase [Segetibacter sp.]